MRRFALIFGILLTLTASVWGSALAAASAWCMHEAGASSASDEHDCCRANIADSDEHHSPSHETSDDAAHETSTTHDQEREAHAGMNCGGAEAASTPETAHAALGQRMQSCVECCAGGSGQTPATVVVVAPEQYKVKRDAGSDSAGVSDLFALAPAHVSNPAPTQHAPPTPPERRHILINVFRI